MGPAPVATTYPEGGQLSKYTVYFVQTVSSAVTVEAESLEDAIDRAYQSGDMPGSMCYGAFGAWTAGA